MLMSTVIFNNVLLFVDIINSASCIFLLQERAISITSGAKLYNYYTPLFLYLDILTPYSVYILWCLIFIKKSLHTIENDAPVHKYNTRNQFELINNFSLFIKPYYTLDFLVAVIILLMSTNSS